MGLRFADEPYGIAINVNGEIIYKHHDESKEQIKEAKNQYLNLTDEQKQIAKSRLWLFYIIPGT